MAIASCVPANENKPKQPINPCNTGIYHHSLPLGQPMCAQQNCRHISIWLQFCMTIRPAILHIVTRLRFSRPDGPSPDAPTEWKQPTVLFAESPPEHYYMSIHDVEWGTAKTRCTVTPIVITAQGERTSRHHSPPERIDRNHHEACK
jgi:hypothetical protein